MKTKNKIQKGSPFYATVLFTEDKTKAVITIGDAEPKVCTSRLDAALYIATCTQSLFSSLSKTQCERSDMSMFKNVSSTLVNASSNLPDYGPNDNTAKFSSHFFSIHAAQVLGDTLVTIIGIFSISSDLSIFINTPANKVMKNPTFDVCSGCQRHGHFLDDEGNRASHEIGSREQAFKWIKEATINGFITPVKAKELRSTINGAKKIGKKNADFYKLLQEFL